LDSIIDERMRGVEVLLYLTWYCKKYEVVLLRVWFTLYVIFYMKWNEKKKMMVAEG